MPIDQSPREASLQYSSTTKGKVYIGTSGWSYDWDFYPSGLSSEDKLSYISENFNSVEIAQSFYDLLTKRKYKKWSDLVPQEFVFSSILFQDITHKKFLKRVKGITREFMERIEGLEGKVGPILVQLGEGHPKNAQLLNDFLREADDVRKGLRYGNNMEFAFEPRHESWFSEDVLDILSKYNTALVFSHSNQIPYPENEPVTADFVYIRLHGPGEIFASEYGRERLKAWAEKIRNWQEKGKDVYVYFNNDINGYAPKDAEILKELTST